MSKPKVIVSPVGVSLFANWLRDKPEPDKRNFWKYTNKRADAIPETDRQQIRTWADEIQQALQDAGIPERRRMSAELNGLYGLYPQGIAGDDYQILIATDTFSGNLAAEILQRFLRETEKVPGVVLLSPADLSTESAKKFSRGVKNLLKELDEQITTYDAQGYEIIFNLTGGFKSLQGYLTVVAMFYADRLVYIFERGDELLTIPRLPIRLDGTPFEKHLSDLARMADGVVLPRQALEALPDSVLEVDASGDATLSDWGLLIWRRLKRRKLTEKLLALPHISYEDAFKKDFESAEWQERLRLQGTLVQVSNLLVDSQGNLAALKSHPGLQYDNYTNKKAGVQPVGHFRVSQELRVSCVYDSEKKALRLRRFGKEPEVNSNP